MWKHCYNSIHILINLEEKLSILISHSRYKKALTHTLRDDNYSFWNENTLDDINIVLDIAEENTDELEYVAIEMIPNKTHHKNN